MFFVCVLYLSVVYQPVPPQPPPPPPLSRHKASKGTSKLASELGVDVGQIGGRGGKYYLVNMVRQVFEPDARMWGWRPTNQMQRINHQKAKRLYQRAE